MQEEILFFNISGVSVFISFIFYAFSWLNKFNILKKIGSILLLISLLTLTLALVYRGIALQFFPLTNLYESLLILAWMLIFVYLILEWKLKINFLGWIVSGLLLAIYLYATWLPETQKEIIPLIPALQSNWRLVHVLPLIMSYALFIIAAFSSAGYLIETFKLSKSKKEKASLNKDVKTINNIKVSSYMREESQKALFFDEVTYRCISIGFPLLTIGIINGALWANHAWGAFWQWDPKETMALVTFFIYAIYLHLRLNTKVSGKTLASVSLLGLVMVYLTYLGVNLYDFGGLHSYGKLE